VRSRIAGFSALSIEDQQRAAAFALKRDLGVDSTRLRLAARALSGKDSDIASIAFVTQPTNVTTARDTGSTINEPAAHAPVELFDAMASGALHWYNAPSGFVVGPMGAATIEHHSDQPDHLPNEVLSMLGHDHTAQRVVLINPQGSIEHATLAMWQAATGASFTVENKAAFDQQRSLTLRAPTRAAIAQPRSALDRALMAACVASVVCMCIAGIARWWQPRSESAMDSANASMTAGDVARRGMGSGELLNRIATVSPPLLRSMKTATFGGGAWVIALNAPSPAATGGAASPDAASSLASTTDSLVATAKALRDNGLLVQTISQPEPRLRVSAP
jgi:hypothetical protein